MPTTRSAVRRHAPPFDLRPAVALAFGAALALPAAAWAAGNEAKGTVGYKDKTATVKYAYLVKGPDSMTKEPIQRVILSATDLGAKIAACKTMSCTDNGLGDGISVNIDSSSRINYWVVMNDQRVQYSGTEPKASFVTIAGDGKRIAGTLKFDKTGAGGPKVDVQFDAALAKEVTAP